MGSKKTEVKLSSAQVAQLFRVTGEAGEIASPEQFRDWAQSSIRKLLPHDALIAGVAFRRGDRVGVQRLVSAGFPMGFIDAVTERRGTFTCPTLEAWFRQGCPQLFEPDAHGADATAEFHAHQLKNVAAHGVLSPSGDSATYFSFSQIPHALTGRHALLLELLAPLLHRAYLRAVGPVSRQPRANPNALPRDLKLTRAEVAVLRELYVDVPTKTIADRLERSENTIKHQLHSLQTKLGARDRDEAVTTAVCLGLLPDRRIDSIRQQLGPESRNRAATADE